MSNSAPSPGSAPQSPPSPPSQTSPPTGAQSSPTASPAPPQGSPPPTQVQNSPPPTSKATPPSYSPPPTSTPPSGSPPSPPPSQSSGSSSPPPTPAVSSNLPPPSGSGSSKSPPPSSNPPPQVPPPPASKSSASHPPPASPNYSPPPTSTPSSPVFSPPPPNTPPAGSVPTPAAPNVPPPPVTGNSGSPPAQTTSPPSAQSPPNAVPSPQAPGSPYQSSTQNPTPPNVPPSTSTPPALQTPNRVPSLSPPSSSTLSQSTTSSKSSSTTSGHGPAIGITVAGVMIVAFVAFFFVVRRRKKKQEVAFSSQYKSTPSNYSGQPDGYYYHSYQHTGGASGQTGGNFPTSPSALGHSYGSHKGYSPQAPDANVMGTQSWFSYEELMEITNGFSRQNILGEGGFGCVYKGWLPDGRIVAVKQLKAGSGQGEREFQAEVEIISRVHHRHLVSLVGYCIADHHRLLVYEFVANKTLEHHLHGKGLPVMEWSKRVKIALGSARGLAYLHEDCHPKIIHRDIKSANILLDDAFEAQVADFGLAKLTNDTNTHVSTRVMGTFGYMAPEYASSGKLTDRSDVFSFGVVLLEIVTGRKSVDPTQPLGEESLVEWARPLLNHALETGDLEEIADPRLEKRYVESEMFRLIETAAACVRHSAQKRPRMSQVVRALDTEGEMTDLSNGVKYGQSTIFESGQNADLQRFRRMAFGSSDDSSDYSIYSGENNSREVPLKTQSSWSQNGSTEFSIVGKGRP